jgi:hypothetical protein
MKGPTLGVGPSELRVVAAPAIWGYDLGIEQDARFFNLVFAAER